MWMAKRTQNHPEVNPFTAKHPFYDPSARSFLQRCTSSRLRVAISGFWAVAVFSSTTLAIDQQGGPAEKKPRSNGQLRKPSKWYPQQRLVYHCNNQGSKVEQDMPRERPEACQAQSRKTCLNWDNVLKFQELFPFCNLLQVLNLFCFYVGTS